jgi:hypothetical protein
MTWQLACALPIAAVLGTMAGLLMWMARTRP